MSFEGNIQNTTATIKLQKLDHVPNGQDLQLALGQARNTPAAVIELPWKTPSSPATYVLKVSSEEGAEETNWVLHKGETLDAAVLWSFDSDDISLIESLIVAECDSVRDLGLAAGQPDEPLRRRAGDVDHPGRCLGRQRRQPAHRAVPRQAGLHPPPHREGDRGSARGAAVGSARSIGTQRQYRTRRAGTDSDTQHRNRRQHRMQFTRRDQQSGKAGEHYQRHHPRLQQREIVPPGCFRKHEIVAKVVVDYCHCQLSFSSSKSLWCS